MHSARRISRLDIEGARDFRIGHHGFRKRMKPRPRSFLSLLFAILLAVSFTPASHATDSAPVAKHIILIIGDGMQPENEIASSRYLRGRDDGLAFHAFPYRASVATWDVTTYNRQAPRSARAPTPRPSPPRWAATRYGPETLPPSPVMSAARPKARNPRRRLGLDGHGLARATRPTAAKSHGCPATRTEAP